jgi:hypothetical protein
MEGSWWILPSPTNSLTPGILFAPQGLFLSDATGTPIKPPYTAGLAPPSDSLEKPAKDLEIFLTTYLFRTGLWATANDSLFNRLFTDTDIPKTSPVRLTTKDDFFLTAVPGLAKYPNMELRAQTNMIAVSQSSINQKGLHFNANNLTVTFTIYNGTTPIPGWQLLTDISFDIVLSPTASKNEIVLKAAIANFVAATSTVRSSVGTVDNSGFSTLFYLLSSVFALPTFSIPLPAGFDPVNPVTVAYFSDYLVISSNYIAA